MMVPPRSDVLVAGGGPAGSMCATMLARRGHDVVLVDKVHHPRETVGESVLPAAWKYFDLLGVGDEISRRFVKKAGGVVAWDNDLTQIAFREFGYDRPGLHVERAALDELLLRNAERSGVRAYEGVRVDGFAPDGDGGAAVTLSGEVAKSVHHCRYLIDATGQASLTARQLGCRKLDDDFRFVSLWGYFVGSRYVSSGGVIRPFEDIPQHPPMTFVTRLSGWGWSWHIPMREVTSVGLVVPVDEYRRDMAAYASLDDYFLALCRRTPRLGELVADARLEAGGVRILRDFSYVSETVAGPGFLVVGDAAGFVDPIFSIGVVMALYSGHLAAWTADRCLRRPATAQHAHRLYAHQMRGRFELARTMALPGTAQDGAAAAAAYFDFFSQAEKDLMWSAASMTTRSINMAVASGGSAAPPVLKRRELSELQPA